MQFIKQAPLCGLIVFEGPVGAGKTTLIGRLKQEFTSLGYRVHTTIEHVPDDLTDYYRDPKNHVFQFQKAFILNLYRIYEDACLQLLENKCDIVLMDRWFYSTRGFFEYQHDQGWLSDSDYDELMFYANSLLTTIPFLPQLLVFVAEHPKVCYERVLARNRLGEKMTEELHADMTEHIWKFNRLCDKMYGSSSRYDLTMITKNARFKKYLEDLFEEVNQTVPRSITYAKIHPLTSFTYETCWPLTHRVILWDISYSRLDEHGFCTYIDDAKEPQGVLTTILECMYYRVPMSSYQLGILNRPENLIHYQKFQTK